MTTDENEKLNFIFGRRSIRIYSPGEVSGAIVTRLLEAAMAAPSAMAKDPWRFVILRHAQTLQRLAESLAGGKMLANAALGIAVCGDLESALEQHWSFLLQDCSAAIENLLLAAHALGLGACWVGVHPSEDSVGQVTQLLALPVSIIPVAIISLGQPGEEPGARTRFNSEYVHLEKWEVR
jgi:nitroreductase